MFNKFNIYLNKKVRFGFIKIINSCYLPKSTTIERIGIDDRLFCLVFKYRLICRFLAKRINITWHQFYVNSFSNYFKNNLDYLYIQPDIPLYRSGFQVFNYEF